MRQAAADQGHDVLIIHAGGAGFFSTTNTFLRYACDWAREGVLIIPTDSSKGLHLVSFFTQAVLIPPPGEPVGIEKLWQVGALGQEFSGRTGTSEVQLVEAISEILEDLVYHSASIGVIGDRSSTECWEGLRTKLPKLRIVDETQIITDMQKIRSKNEQDQIRASAQLMDIGFQAACHVTMPGVTDFEIYAAVTFAQMARGGESGDGYQIGINRFGTHCGKPYGHKVVSGDLINLYMSALPYHGYTAQTARMIAVGEITTKQEETLEVCAEAVRRAEALIRPGVRFCDLHKAAFSVYLEHGYLEDDTTATMPYNWAPHDDLSARIIPIQHIQNRDYERDGRKLKHVYPAVTGPHNPNMGHSVGMPGNPKFNITSHNTDIAEPGMVFVLHAQWLDPMVSGGNIGNCYLVTDDGFENLSCHTPLDSIRIKA
ncbi:Xaa-Pro peptidase family protein [Sporosarcina sp. Marseille-Q4943]|uniref:M24 family metallopeptidase n=1 Tax=Sporosarcina sp. Marseille-Q4943 TaxID=2942204 RepID=UPI00208DD15F|nr:Xaa-Pro peptidase family protein [Sporosarcina sp. Marseille-Q4943]